MILSNYTITFDKSSDFTRIILLIYCCAFGALFQTAWSWPVKLVLTLLLLLMLLRAIQEAPEYRSLTRQNGEWFLQDSSRVQATYNKLRVLVDAELFFLLEFRSEKARKVIVLFSDQMTQESYRLLRLSEKL